MSSPKPIKEIAALMTPVPSNSLTPAVGCESDHCTAQLLQYTILYTTLYTTVGYITMQYTTVQYTTVQYATVQYATVQNTTLQYSSMKPFWSPAV